MMIKYNDLHIYLLSVDALAVGTFILSLIVNNAPSHMLFVPFVLTQIRKCTAMKYYMPSWYGIQTAITIIAIEIVLFFNILRIHELSTDKSFFPSVYSHRPIPIPIPYCSFGRPFSSFSLLVILHIFLKLSWKTFIKQKTNEYDK